MKLGFNQILQQVLSNKGNAFFYTPAYYKNSRSYLFKNPFEEKVIKSAKNIKNQFQTIDDAVLKGIPVYGYTHYELGYEIEEKLKSRSANESKLLGKFFLFNPDSINEFSSADIAIIKEDFKDFQIYDFQLLEDKKTYLENISKIKNYIRIGDTYQVNYTIGSEFKLRGEIEHLILNLIFNQSAKYIAIINDYPKIIISISPELFFEYKNNVLISRPMKGTIKRGKNIGDDNQHYTELLLSKKDKAENIMIVDLLRNDMGKISQIDSVKVEKQFEVEKYESVYQMTSTITSQVLGSSISNILFNLFPCGSITGAPKIRTMEIIDELENYERGIYTGSIGMILDMNMTFNVPIRTIEFDIAKQKGRLPLGSGIVWDSDAEKEYSEIKLKAEFLTDPKPYFELLETMLVEHNSVFLLDYHEKRLKKSAEYFLFKYDKASLHEKLNGIIDTLNAEQKYKLRLTLNKWGYFNIDVEEVFYYKGQVKIKVSNSLVNTQNRFQYFKTTNRNLYDSEYRKCNSNGYYDVLFFNENGELAEGAISNVIIKKNNFLFTPPLHAGILSGCYRKFLIDNNKIQEKSISRTDLKDADEVFLCNSVRKMIKVDIIDD